MHYGFVNWFHTATPVRNSKAGPDTAAPEQHESVRDIVSATAALTVQRKPKLSQPQDALEVQAEAVAKKIVSDNSPVAQSLQLAHPAHIHRQCSECEEELQRKRQNRSDTASRTPGLPPLSAGQPLSSSLRSYFEPRFGADFRNVRLHRDEETANFAESINARAFTYGNHIGFGHQTYSESTGGKKLLAHELTHVLQQGNTPTTGAQIHRDVSDFSSCPDDVNGAPPSATMFLGLAEVVARSDLSFAAMMMSFDITNLEGGNRPVNSHSFNAYLERFGLPELLGNGKFRDRFSGRQFDTENEAILAELRVIKARLLRIAAFFDRNIRYRCTSDTARLTIGSCTDRCNGAFAWVCAAGGAPNTVVICPAFWAMSASDQAIGLAHEAAHLVFGFGDPAGASMTTRRRAINPVCYSDFSASMSERGTPDPDCPALALPGATAPIAPVPGPAPALGGGTPGRRETVAP